MEADGLVTRTRDPRNRRTHHVEVTAEGHAQFRSLLGAAQAFDQRVRAGFTAAELATLRRLLQRLATNAGRQDLAPATTRDTTTLGHHRRKEPR
jgi:MarR family transcriptional regulator for hemolysin